MLRKTSPRAPHEALVDALRRADGHVSRAFPSRTRSMLAEIYPCHACSCHDTEDGNGRTGRASEGRPDAAGAEAPPPQGVVGVGVVRLCLPRAHLVGIISIGSSHAGRCSGQICSPATFRRWLRLA
eukprot:COSAG01_NODE_1838_length_9083_cov_3.184328_7_plen_126_part_00